MTTTDQIIWLSFLAGFVAETVSWWRIGIRQKRRIRELEWEVGFWRDAAPDWRHREWQRGPYR